MAVLPAAMVCVLGVAETAKSPAGAVPVPDKALVCGEPAALSATESVAVKLAAEAGVKTTEMVQVAPAASEEPQVLVWLKSAGLVPVRVMPEMVSAPLPVLLSVAFCAALAVPAVDVKVSVAGVSEAAGAAAVVPVPESDAVWGELEALSVTVTVPGREPRDCGSKVTAMVQVAPAASVLPQVVVAA